MYNISGFILHCLWASQVVLVEESACLAGNKEMQIQSRHGEDSLEEHMATHSIILAWRIPWTKSMEGYSPQGRKDSGMTKVN